MEGERSRREFEDAMWFVENKCTINEIFESGWYWGGIVGELMIMIKIHDWKIIGNDIGESGAKMISEGLKSNNILTRLDLSSDEKRRK